MQRNFMGRKQGKTQAGKPPSSPMSLRHPHEEKQRPLRPDRGSFCPFQTPRSQGRRTWPVLGTTPSSFLPPVCARHGHTALGHMSIQVKAEGMMHVDPHVGVSPRVSSPAVPLVTHTHAS